MNPEGVRKRGWLPVPRSRARRARGALAAMVGLALSSGAVGQVVLRGNQGRLDGRIIEVGPAGAVVEQSEGGRATRRVVGLDRIRRIEGDHAAAWSALEADADSLWRVRTRIERGDWAAAEAELAAMRGGLRETDGPTAVVAQDALLRCRSARGARAGAVAAWIDLLAACERSGAWSAGTPAIAPPAVWIGGTIGGLPVVDARTGLVPTLPPIWIGEPAMDAAAAGGEWTPPASGKAATAAELAALYAAAAQAEAGIRAGGEARVVALPAAVSGAEGVRLVRLIVQARAGNEAERAAARDSLRVVMSGESTESWQEAWCRAALGRSLLLESEHEHRISGVIELLHVPARLGAASPYLAGVCLAEAAAALWEMGDAQAAAALKNELLSVYPGHPAANWSRLTEIAPPVAQTGAPLAAAGRPDRRPAPESGGER